MQREISMHAESIVVLFFVIFKSRALLAGLYVNK